MPIEIPRIGLNQEQPVQAPNLQNDVPNTEAPMAKISGAINSAGNEVIKYRDQMAYHEADNIATENDNEFQAWHKKQLYGDPTTGQTGILYQEGDPKQIYNDFYKRAQDKLDDLSKAPDGQDWSDLTQNVVNRRLNKRAEELQSEALTQYGHQKYEYEIKNRDTAVSLAQQKMPNYSSQVDPDHPETFGPLQAAIDDIKKPIISHALQYGGAVQSDDGSVVLTPAVKQQIAKATSDGLYKTIDNLYNSDQGDGVAMGKADAIKQQFGDLLDPFHKDAASDKAEKIAERNQSLKLAQKIMYADDPQAEVRKSGLSLDIQDKALAAAAEQRGHIDKLQNSEQKANFGILWNQVNSVQNSNQPYSGLIALEKDPVYAQTWDKLNVTQKKAIQQMVTQPKQTSPSSLSNMMNIVSGQDTVNHPNGLYGMTPQDFQLAVAGMSKSDQSRYQTMWNNVNKLQNGQQLAQERMHGMNELKDQAMSLGIVRADNADGTNVTKGGANDQALTQLKDQFNDSISHYGNMPIPDMRAAVRQFLVNRSVNKPYAIPRFQGSGAAFGNQGASASPPASTGNVQRDAYNAFVNDKKVNPNGDEPHGAQLQEYIRTHPELTKGSK